MRGGVRLRGLLRAEHELEQTRSIPQVDEDQAAVVAPAVHPAGHARLAVHVVGSQRARPGAAVVVLARGLHLISSRASPTLRTSCWSPVCMLRTLKPPSARITTHCAPILSACFSCPFSERPACSISALRPRAFASITSP